MAGLVSLRAFTAQIRSDWKKKGAVVYRNIATYIKNGKQVIWLATWDRDGKRVEEEHTIRQIGRASCRERV